MAIVLKGKLAADIPTPPTGKKTFFIDSVSGEPKLKDDAGAVATLQGAPGANGSNGAQGPQGDPGPQGPAGASNTDAIRTDFVIEDDFASGGDITRTVGKHGWELSSGGTGNNAGRIPGVAGHPGIFRLQGGTVATARACIALGTSGAHCIVPGTAAITFEGIMALTGDAAAHLQSAMGLGDSFAANGDQANGIYIRLTSAGGWELVCASGGVRTAVVLSSYSTGVWKRLGFVVNAAGTSVQGTVAGVNTGAPITTNIPAIAISPFAKTDAIAGGTALAFDLDKYFLNQPLSR